MDEKSTIKDLERQASNTKLLMDRLTRAAYEGSARGRPDTKSTPRRLSRPKAA